MYLDKGFIIAVAATIAAHTNSISVGMCQGYSAVLLPQLQADATLNISQEEASWIASLGVISTPGGALLSGIITEILGRKAAVQLTTLPFLLGWATIAFSANKISLCIGRFISGLAIGMASACYIYVAEISLPDHRGFLSAFGPIFVSLGVLIVYSLGYLLKWQAVSAVCAGVAVLSFAAMHLVPESPSWLVSKDLISEATNSLVWLRRSPAVADAELADILHSVKKNRDQENHEKSLRQFVLQCCYPSVWKPFLILIIFFLFQEGSGIYIVLYYAVNVFQNVGSTMDDYVASIIVATVRLLMSITGSVCIQHFNRKTLAITSGLGMAISMGAAGTYEYFYSALPVIDRPASWVPFVCIIINVCASMLGMLQLPWLMTGELFPLSVRGMMGGTVSSLAYLFIFGTVKVYPGMQRTLQLHEIMWIFTAASFGVVIYVKFFLPETRGKTLHEIEMNFIGKGNSTSTEVLEKCEKDRPSNKEVYIVSKNVL
ncbi:facilitated trehalose transporter Tret1-like isoform X2 [Lycorma delicatula]|uniref:facilitated trehalose transporter Tret1-like isoform X2 n=1 Tax=Lycorma delicatula TaxID=130591 RepID=UPI003F51A76E